MSAIDLLKDPLVSSFATWTAIETLFGAGARAWEPETLHLELARRGVDWTDALSARVLGAQTILTSPAWAYDHDVLYAFALACDGHPAGGIAHPTVVQLAWAVKEIEELTGGKIGEDEGFDPDTVDPAIALILHDDGWVLAPEELRFCQHELIEMNQEGSKLLTKVSGIWEKIHKLDEEALRQAVQKAPDDAVSVQIAHLADCAVEIRARSRLREQHLRDART